MRLSFCDTQRNQRPRTGLDGSSWCDSCRSAMRLLGWGPDHPLYRPDDSGNTVGRGGAPQAQNRSQSDQSVSRANPEASDSSSKGCLGNDPHVGSRQSDIHDTQVGLVYIDLLGDTQRIGHVDVFLPTEIGSACHG